MNDFNCESVLGAANLSIGSVFRTIGVIPDFVIRWPNHSQVFSAN